MQGFATDIEDLFQRQQSALDTFNIVLFGRTGSGKSTLIETFTRGDGQSVSPGELDWTLTVTDKEWQSCKIYDTPGINGWGGRADRSDLEKLAREAIETADIVLVCFDNSSQLDEEFKKLADWVQTFNKPVVAVLNVCNSRWRMPPKVPIGSQRAVLSRAVREHASNVVTQMERAGFARAPVVAISSKRALTSRSSLPYAGPDDAEAMQRQRELHGIDRLEDWSNFPRLEQLMATAIRRNAAEIRLGALHSQLQGVVKSFQDSLTQITKQAVATTETIEKEAIAKMLRLVGYPPQSDEALRKPFLADDGSDMLEELEELRGGQFQAPSRGELEEFISQRLSAELGGLEAESLACAEEMIISAFEQPKEIEGSEISAKAFDKQKIEESAKGVLAEAAVFARRKVKLAIGDAEADLRAMAQISESANGRKGSGMKWAARGAKAGGILAGAATATLMALAALNIWNPVGWVLAVGGIVSAALGFIGGPMRKRAEKKRLEARSKTLAKIREEVRKVYDNIRSQVAEAGRSYCIEVAKSILSVPVRQALDYRKVEHAGLELQRNAAQMVADLPVTTADAANLLMLAMHEVQEGMIGEGAQTPNAVWLGESWIQDPLGLEAEFREATPKRTKAYDPGAIARMRDALRAVFARVGSKVRSGEGGLWLDSALASLEGDSEALEAFADLREIAARGRPRIHLLGDYSAGKSSFIKRLLLDDGKPVPEELEIRADPTTEKVRVYPWQDVDLVDTPGFQSAHGSHTERALSSMPDAAAIILLFQPNLVTGDDAALRLGMNGSREEGLVPKREFTFLAINRADELGVDPQESPEQFLVLSERKRVELRRALEAREITIANSDIFCMASDPYGLVADRRDVSSADFDDNRAWDGFDAFMQAYRSVAPMIRETGLDLTLLHGGIARLRKLAKRVSALKERRQEERAAVLQLVSLIEDAVTKATIIANDQKARLRRVMRDAVAGLRNEVLEEGDQKQLDLKAGRINTWWEDKAIQGEVTRWSEEAATAFEDWHNATNEILERKLQSKSFKAAFPDLNSGEFGKETHGPKPKWFADAFGKAGNVLGKADRKVVYRAGKALGVKFKSWGAVKAAKFMGKAGAVLAVVGVAFDVLDFIHSEKAIEKDEDLRMLIDEFLADSLSRVCEQILHGNEESPGFLHQIEESQQAFTEQRESIEVELGHTELDIRALEQRLENYERLASQAEQKAGVNYEI